MWLRELAATTNTQAAFPAAVPRRPAAHVTAWMFGLVRSGCSHTSLHEVTEVTTPLEPPPGAAAVLCHRRHKVRCGSKTLVHVERQIMQQAARRDGWRLFWIQVIKFNDGLQMRVESMRNNHYCLFIYLFIYVFIFFCKEWRSFWQLLNGTWGFC